jgi:HD-GYP domain-containing protein (c-di-GMP phosphodiesterase class II)
MVLTSIIDPDLAARPETAHGFLLHDIGKIGIPERLLLKTGPLNPSEWDVMRTHPVVGAHIVTPIRVLGDAVDVVRFHHERFDGRGYPHGLRGKEIPLAARIFSVVDAYDAMTSDRPYRQARSPDEAIEELARCSGTQFDPYVIEAFLVLSEENETLLLPEAHEQEPHDHPSPSRPVITG